MPDPTISFRIPQPPRLLLRPLPGRYAVCRLPAGSPIPQWALDARGLSSITRTDEEVSILAEDRAFPSDPSDQGDLRIESGWVALRVDGQLDFDLVGIMASLSGTLAEAGVPMFAISTFDTDILLVKERDAERAVAALSKVADVEGAAVTIPKK